MSNNEYIRKEFTSLVYTELRHCYSYFNLNTLTTHSYLLIESLEMIFLRFTYPCPSSLMFPTKSQRCRFGLSHSILPESLIKLSMSFMSDVSGNPCKKNQFVMTSKITFQYINPIYKSMYYKSATSENQHTYMGAKLDRYALLSYCWTLQ